MYHGVSLNDIIGVVPGMDNDHPEKSMRLLMQVRHLVPMYGGKTMLSPENRDYMVVDKVPDIFHGGHIHVLGYCKYRNTLVVNSGGWQLRPRTSGQTGPAGTPKRRLRPKLRPHKKPTKPPQSKRRRSRKRIKLPRQKQSEKPTWPPVSRLSPSRKPKKLPQSKRKHSRKPKKLPRQKRNEKPTWLHVNRQKPNEKPKRLQWLNRLPRQRWKQRGSQKPQ